MKKGFQYVLDKIKRAPEDSGCYLMSDEQNQIFYIGKAKNIRSRLKSYFSGTDTRIFVQYLEEILYDINFLLVNNNTEALLLERELIKKHKPRFNIMLKDDKNYILLKINKPKINGPKRDIFPKIELVRKQKKDQARYFGPYPSAHELRTTLHIINKYFLLRSCPDNILENRTRPCIQHQIGRCMAPCVYPSLDYTQEIANIILFLSGNYQEVQERLRAKMWTLSENQNYEAAAQVRDQLQAIKSSLTKQVIKQVNLQKNQDIIGFARQGPEIEITCLKIRNGSWSQSNNFSFSEQPFPDSEIMRSFLYQAYLNNTQNSSQNIPTEILININIHEDVNIIKNIIKQKTNKNTHIFIPQKGTTKKLLSLAEKNAHTALQERLTQTQANKQALIALKNKLNLNIIPEHIECIDISIIQNSDPFGSCIVFTNGIPNKKLYRIYKIKNTQTMNDFAMIKEVVTRRIKKGLKEENLPDLLLIDGGKGQLNCALEAISQQNLLVTKDNFYVAGIAKARTQKEAKILNPNSISRSSERLFVPNNSNPIILEPHTFERYLVERIRDEAHRFAISAHRKGRKKRTLHSMLLSIPGIGKTRALKLLRHFGSVKNIAKSTPTELAKIIGVNQKKSAEIIKFLDTLIN